LALGLLGVDGTERVLVARQELPHPSVLEFEHLAGQPIELIFDNLPHHSRAPRAIALALTVGIVLVGIFASGSPSAQASSLAADRKKLVARRERLMHDLVRLEADHRAGRGDPRRYASRREELVAALEHVYGALDDDAEPIDRPIAARPRPDALRASSA